MRSRLVNCLEKCQMSRFQSNGFILSVLGLSASPVESGTVLLNVGLQTNKCAGIGQLNHGFV